METTITATELARSLSDILNRVKYRGESFKVMRNGEVIAILEPASPPVAEKTHTWGEFVDRWQTMPKPDPDYWEILEEAHREMNQLPPTPAWEKEPAASSPEKSQ